MIGFVRKKKIHGKVRHYWCRTYRDPETGKVKQKVIAYLGDHKTPAARLAYLQNTIPYWHWDSRKIEEYIKRVEKFSKLCSAYNSSR